MFWRLLLTDCAVDQFVDHIQVPPGRAHFPGEPLVLNRPGPRRRRHRSYRCSTLPRRRLGLSGDRPLVEDGIKVGQRSTTASSRRRPAGVSSPVVPQVLLSLLLASSVCVRKRCSAAMPTRACRGRGYPSWSSGAGWAPSADVPSGDAQKLSRALASASGASSAMWWPLSIAWPWTVVVHGSQTASTSP